MEVFGDVLALQGEPEGVMARSHQGHFDLVDGVLATVGDVALGEGPDLDGAFGPARCPLSPSDPSYGVG